MKASLAIRATQSMVLTPQLLQSIRLLQLSTLELEQEIEQALEDNVMLEADETYEAADESTITPGPAVAIETESVPEAATGCDAGVHSEVEADFDWSSSESWSGGEPADEDDEPWTSRTAAPTSGDARVGALEQLRMMVRTRRESAIVTAIVENIDDNGYLECPLGEIGSQLGDDFDATSTELEAALTMVQSVEPTGFGARNLVECLRLQLEILPGSTPGRELALYLVANGLELVAERRLDQVRRELHASEAEMKAAFNLVLALDPKPGASQGAPAEAAIPDVIVSGRPGAWRVELNTERLPRIRVNGSYERAIATSAHRALKDKLQEARWLVRGLEMRHETLLKTARAVFERQKGFLEHGEERMVPLTLREIADAIGMHESTVCRVTTAKFIQTPWGVYDFKSFFPSQITGSDIEASGTAVKAMIRRIVDSENRLNPLCDGAIGALLLRQGIRVARRTVAKYREAMKIAPATARRTAPVRRGQLVQVG
ncbi:RNA polymerase RpoN-/SigL-like sigma 54 subunit [Panacagrimonas perspica]|uniref:RNA polymerase sigma-54 factor n=1 Tax=Panacagrimonas perspica TaxID=381431 RepID=A0A4R7PCZ3_9GAMM|nr:RNA polymerase factor sigma-54 [Panacagrimonas perspica]TDU31120.1 RNA polymerase RpoN-/SigL-like sigma 54 subunit [Panacagrimonas perspica]THD01745.1 RNA polymerase sigma-54 factor [Panacagrimonas perspica]